MNRVSHFDISGEKPEELIPFYEKVFKWKFQKWDGPMEYWFIMTGSEEKTGINCGLGKRQEDDRVVNTIDVKDIDESIEKITQNGGNLLKEKMEIPGVGWFAQFKDPEGNVFGLMQDTSQS